MCGIPLLDFHYKISVEWKWSMRSMECVAFLSSVIELFTHFIL